MSSHLKHGHLPYTQTMAEHKDSTAVPELARSAPSMMGNIAASIGPAMLKRKLALRREGYVPGGRLNVDINRLNSQHPADNTARLGTRIEDEAKIAQLEQQRNQTADPRQKKQLSQRIAAIKRRHFTFQTINKETNLYNDDGTAITNNIPAKAPVRINAGAITKLLVKAVDTKPVDCVFVFMWYKKGEQKMDGGWLPTAHLDKSDTVADLQWKLAKKIQRERGDKVNAPALAVPVHEWTAKQDGTMGLYTYPYDTNPKKNKQKPNQNLADHYYGNLLLNLPNTGDPRDNRFGVETDRFVNSLPEADKTFYKVDPTQIVNIPLYEPGRKLASGKDLTFVYGYFKNNAKSMIYGWINQKMLI